MPPAADALGQRLRVLYDPVGYLPGWGRATATLAGAQRSALNAAMIRLHALPPYAPPAPEQARWTRRLLRAWDAIPAAAYLLACAAWGERLAGRPAFGKLDPHGHLILQLRFPVSPASEDAVPATRDALAAWGGACLLASLPELPSWLRARIGVRFDPLPPLRRPAQAHAADLSCFAVALAHAQKNPGFSRSFCP